MNNGHALRIPVKKMWVWTGLLVFLASSATLAQTVSDIRIVTPRDFGYTIGDRIRREIHLSLRVPQRLDITTLPETARLNRWLEVSEAQVSAEYGKKNAVYHIVVEYQILNAPAQLSSVTIPQHEVLTTGGTNPISVSIPEWTFSIAPITDSSARDNLRLLPDHRPQPIPVTGRRNRLLISALLLAGLLAYLTYRRILLPRLKRDRFAFANAIHELRRLQRLDSGPESYRLGLQVFHAAVNTTAGKVVFAGNLSEFLADKPEYAVLKAELTALFARSQDVFFKNCGVPDPDTSLGELLDLCRHCRSLEGSAA